MLGERAMIRARRAGSSADVAKTGSFFLASAGATLSASNRRIVAIPRQSVVVKENGIGAISYRVLGSVKPLLANQCVFRLSGGPVAIVFPFKLIFIPVGTSGVVNRG